MRMVIRAALATCWCLVHSLAFAQAVTAPPATTVQVNRASRDTWTPLMDVLKAQRTPVTDAQMARLRELPIEAIWGALQGRRVPDCASSPASKGRSQARSWWAAPSPCDTCRCART